MTRRRSVLFALGVLFLIGFYLTCLPSYLLLQNLIKLFSVCIAFTICTLTWNTREFLETNYLRLLGISYVFVGGFDALHVLAYESLTEDQGSGSALAAKLWMVARSIEGLSFLLASLLMHQRKRLNLTHLFISYSAVTLFLLTSIFHTRVFPSCYVEGVGPTDFLRTSEYTVCVILLASLGILLRSRTVLKPDTFLPLAGSVTVAAVSELTFALHITSHGISDSVGALLRATSLCLVYRALIKASSLATLPLRLHGLGEDRDYLKKVAEQRAQELERTDAQLVEEIEKRQGMQDELSQQETVVKKQFEFLEHVYHTAPVGLCLIDTDLCYVRVNERLAEMNGHPVLDHIGQPIRHLIPDLAAEMESACQQVIETGIPVLGIETQGVIAARPDERQIWLVSYYPFRIPEGVVTGVSVVVQDVHKLRKSEQDLARAQQIARVGSWEWDIAEDVTRFSREGFRILGFDSDTEPLDSQVLLALIRPEDRRTVQTCISHAVQGVEPYKCEYYIVRPDGTERALRSQGEVIFSMSGKPLNMVGTIQDITEEKNAERALRESEEKYRMVFETAREGISICHIPEGISGPRILIDCNPRYAEMSGYSRAELLKIGDMHSIQKDLQTSWQRDKNIAKVQKEEPYSGVFSWLRPDNQENYIEYAATPFHMKGEQHVLSIDHDVTMERRVQRLLTTSLQEKETLLREVHHRVKNNLQIISSLLNMQARQVENPATQQAFRESRNRIRSMALVHEKLYRSENLSGTDFKGYVQQLASHLIRSYSFGGRGIHLSLDVQETSFGIDTAISCGLLVSELISNAIKHAFPDGNARDGSKAEIRIELRSEDLPDGGLQWLLTVSDNGIGFPQEFIAQEISIEPTGSLGLKLVQTLAGQLKGKLELSNQDGAQVRIRWKDTSRAENHPRDDHDAHEPIDGNPTGEP